MSRKKNNEIACLITSEGNREYIFNFDASSITQSCSKCCSLSLDMSHYGEIEVRWKLEGIGIEKDTPQMAKYLRKIYNIIALISSFYFPCALACWCLNMIFIFTLLLLPVQWKVISILNIDLIIWFYLFNRKKSGKENMTGIIKFLHQAQRIDDACMKIARRQSEMRKKISLGCLDFFSFFWNVAYGKNVCDEEFLKI
jgi:hypothetical protein